ncbi:CoxG family protein [Alteribacillus sp. YIM 98480]|uniref:CoxG family protein n=1 Tax=Alteribacillus sp. YIM 98480 TaxID=2606599 RepID=UPI00131B5DA9|nr:carbon monoxide dehydrogenase subunit G [Alteribacillus sp. YIM 98480]
MYAIEGILGRASIVKNRKTSSLNLVYYKLIVRGAIMEVSGKYNFNATPEQVWEKIMDPDSLSKTIPGCEKLEEIDTDTYIAHVKLGVAAIKGKYEGKVQILDKQKPEHYQLNIEGEGSPGWVKGQMVVDLVPNNDKTTLNYKVTADVGGVIASVGSRLLTGVSKMLIGDMFKKLNNMLKEEESVNSQ